MDIPVFYRVSEPIKAFFDPGQVHRNKIFLVEFGI